jgi:hypothetical protein
MPQTPTGVFVYLQSVDIAKNHLVASVQILHIDLTMKTTIFIEALVSTSKIPTSSHPSSLHTWH